MEEQQQNRRILPKNEIDFALFMVDSLWGKDEVSQQLKDKLTDRYLNQEQPEEIIKKELWGLLAYYTRDLRLGNLTQGELDYCRYFLDLGGHCLVEDYTEPFLLCIQFVATITETSQSRNGFLRKRMTTVTSETAELEPPKKSLFGGKKRPE